MAHFTTAAGIDDLTGKLSKRDKCGPKEAFARNKRNYKRSPRTEAEVIQNNKWTAVCQEATRIIHDPGHARYGELYERWVRQANGHADPVTGKRMIAQFGNFVRAVLNKE